APHQVRVRGLDGVVEQELAQQEGAARGEWFGVSVHQSILLTGTPAFSAILTMLAVPRPPGNAITSSAPASSISRLRIMPAALPCLFQSAGCGSSSTPSALMRANRAQLPAKKSAPLAAPWTRMIRQMYCLRRASRASNTRFWLL